MNDIRELFTETKSFEEGLYWIDDKGKLLKVKGGSHDRLLAKYPKYLNKPGGGVYQIRQMYDVAFKDGWIRIRFGGNEFNAEYNLPTVSKVALKKMVDLIYENRKEIQSLIIEPHKRGKYHVTSYDGVDNQFLQGYGRYL